MIINSYLLLVVNTTNSIVLRDYSLFKINFSVERFFNRLKITEDYGRQSCLKILTKTAFLTCQNFNAKAAFYIYAAD